MTALGPPASTQGWLRRESLLRRLDEGAQRRLTVVTAGAGFGKSALLSEWTATRRHGWVAAAAGDATPTGASLFRALVTALRPVVPPTTASPLDRMLLGDLDQELARVDEIVGVWCEQLAREPAEMVLVLDDVHEIEASPVSVWIVEALCRQAPTNVHLVLASRSALPFPVERMRGQGQVLTLTADDLAFDLAEVAAMLRAFLPDASAALAESLHRLTAGWPALIRMAVEALRPVPPSTWDKVLADLADASGPVFGYLAREVIEHQPAPVLALLRAGTVLERFTAPLAEHVGVPGAKEALLALEGAGGLVEQPEPGRFALHALVRQVYARHWPIPDEEATKIRRRAIDWLEAVGEIEWALSICESSGDPDGLATLLTDHGSGLLTTGRPYVVARLVDALPGPLRSQPLDQLAGEAYSVLGEHDHALRCLAASACGQPLSPALAWRMMQAHYFRDDLEAGMDTFAHCDRAAGEDRDVAMLLSWAASITARLGAAQQTSELAEQALVTAELCADDRALAAAHTAAALAAGPGSDPETRTDHLRRALAFALRAADSLQTVRVRNAQGSALLEQGDYAAAIRELDAAASEAERAGFAGLRALVFMNRGLAHWCRGRLDDASADYEKAVTVYRDTGSQEVCYALIGRGDVHREQGNLALARAAYEEGLGLAERAGDRQGVVPGLYQLAKVLVDDDPERATALVHRAVAYGWPDRAWAHNAAGWVALSHGDRSSATEAATAAAAAARELRDRFGLAESMELAALCADDPETAIRLLEEARAVWQQLDNPVHDAACTLALSHRERGPAAHAAAERAHRTLRQHGVRVRASGAAGLLRFVATDDQVPVAVHVLGGFSVSRNGRPVAAAEWRSHKARDLLTILVARRGVGVSREQVMEALWSGQDPDRLRNRLSVALSTLRSLLDPDRRYGPAHFVSADRDQLRLDLAHVVVDVELFLHEADTGLSAWSAGQASDAISRLSHAEGLYNGDVLEDDPYAEWAAELREESRTAYVSVTHTLAEHALAADNPVLASGYLRRVLARDRYDEHANLLLVRALGLAGRHGDARRAYGDYVHRMREIEVEPVPFPAEARVSRAAGPGSGPPPR